MVNKKSSAYWKKRFSQLENSQNQYAQNTFHQIEGSFDKAQRQIQSQIESWYARYASNNGITMVEARKHLSASELKELKWDVKEYIQYGHENAMNGQWMKELENASAKYHISRLEALKLRSQQALEVAFGNETDSIDSMMRNLYQSGYYHTCFEVQKGFNIGWEIGQIDENKLNKVISRPWTADGKNFSDRVWQSKTSMVNELHQQMTRTILQGKAPDEAIRHISKYIKDKTKNVKYQAGRLVMTEQAFISSAAQQDAFNDLDVEEYEIVATLDSHTSQICQDMDGQHFPMKDFEPGVTAPPFHVWCRSTTVPYFEDNFGGERAARGEDGKTYYVPDDMTYKDWKKSLVDGDTDGLTEVIPKKFVEITDAMDFAYGDYTDDDFFKWEDNYNKHNSNVKLTSDEIQIVEDYTEGGYIGFNNVSRGMDESLYKKGYSAEDIARIREKADVLEDVLGRYDLDTDIVTHRFERDVSWLTGKGNDIEDLEKLIGTEYTTDGFTSSGMFPNRRRFTGGKSDAVHFEIVTPKGTNGAYLSMSKKGENEFLYNRGTKFKVLDGGERVVKEHKYNLNTGKFEEVDVTERFLKVQVIPDTIDVVEDVVEDVGTITRNYKTELAQKFGQKHYDDMHDLIDSCENTSLQKVWEQYEADITVGDASYKGHEHCNGSTIYVNGSMDAKGDTWQSPYQVSFHESGHAIDYLARSKVPSEDWDSMYYRHYSSAYKKGLFPKTIKNEVDAMVSELDVKMKAEFKAHATDIDWLIDHDYISGWNADWYKKYGELFGGQKPKYSKSMAYNAIEKEIRALEPKAKADLSDILEGATNGRISCGFGHGKSYWQERTYGGVKDGLATEAFAEMIDSTIACPESLEAIKKYLPKSYSVFEEMIAALLE